MISNPAAEMVILLHFRPPSYKGSAHGSNPTSVGMLLRGVGWSMYKRDGFRAFGTFHISSFG
jgi:hypothetical protein